MSLYENEPRSQASRGDPISIRNLVRQATVHLAGEDAGEEGGGEDEDETPEKNHILIIILTTIILFCIVILVIYVFGHFSETFITVILILFVVWLLTWVFCC